MSDMPTVKDIVRNYLYQHGFEGLCNPDICGCSREDIMPCGPEISERCMPARQGPDGHGWLVAEPVEDTQRARDERKAYLELLKSNLTGHRFIFRKTGAEYVVMDVLLAKPSSDSEWIFLVSYTPAAKEEYGLSVFARSLDDFRNKFLESQTES